MPITVTTDLPQSPIGSLSLDEATDSITVSWTKEDNSSTGGYALERSSDGGATWTAVATPSLNTTTYEDTSVSEGVTYQYRLIRSTDHVSASDISSPARLNKQLSRTTVIAESGSVSATRSPIVKSRQTNVSGAGAISSERTTNAPRSTTISSDGAVGVTRDSLHKKRTSTIGATGRLSSYVSFQKAFRSTRYLDWEYDGEKSGFVSEWVDETKVHRRNGAVGAYVEGWVGDDPISLQIEYSEDGETVDERSGVRYILGANRVETFESLSGDTGYYRIILRYLRLDDNVVEVNVGLTHT